MEAGLALGFLLYRKSWFKKAGAVYEQELFHSRGKGLLGSHLSGGLGVEGLLYPWVLTKGALPIFPLKIAIIKQFPVS